MLRFYFFPSTLNASQAIVMLFLGATQSWLIGSKTWPAGESKMAGYFCVTGRGMMAKMIYFCISSFILCVSCICWNLFPVSHQPICALVCGSLIFDSSWFQARIQVYQEVIEPSAKVGIYIARDSSTIMNEFGSPFIVFVSVIIMMSISF